MIKNRYENLKSIKPFYAPYKLKIVLFSVFAFASGAFALTYPYVSSEIILNLTSKNFSEMTKFCIILLSFIIANSVIYFMSDFFYARVTNGLFFDLRKSVISKMMSLRLSVIYDKGSGYFLERLNEDTKELSNNRLDIIKQFIHLVVNLGFVSYIVVLNWQIGLIFFAGIILLIVLEHLRVSKLLANKKLGKRAGEKVKVAENEIIKGVKEIKGLNAKESLLTRHSNVNGKYVKIKYNREIYDKRMQKIIDVAKAVLDFALLVIAGLYLIPKGKIELLAVLVIYNYKGNIYDLIAGFAKIRDYHVNGELASKRLNEVIKAHDEAFDSFGDKTLDKPIEKIEFCKVAFDYDSKKPILKDISFTISKNSLVGFVGSSGSGKTTIFNLLTNFYKKKGGEILINGIPFDELSETTVRDNISLVLQDPYIFNDTLINNVKIAKPEASDEDVVNVCKLAELDDEIMLMENGYETMLGESGTNLSGGQKQRLEIARVLLKDTGVILFDEATSALDKINLNKINSLLLKLKDTKIILVIAHRLAVMRLCNEVFALDNGIIANHGTHEKLLETSTFYQSLFKKKEN